MKQPTISFDQVLNTHIGALGRWQVFLFIVVTLSSIPPLIQFPQLAFLTPEHHCAQPELQALGWSKKAIAEVTLPIDKSGYSQCSQYNISMELLLEIDNSSPPTLNSSVVTCQHGWTFDRKTAPFVRSFTEEFELICDRKYLIPIISLAYIIGMGFGYPAGGYLGDKYGRRKVWAISCLVSFVFSVASAMSVSIWMFFVFRIGVGAVSSFANVAGYVLCMEITNAQHRNTFNFIFYLINDSLGGYAVLVAYFTQDWRLYHVIATIFCLLTIFVFRVVPESPRWLLYRGEIDKAKQVLFDGAKMNGRMTHVKGLAPLLSSDVDEISRSDSASTSEDGAQEENNPKWYQIFTAPQFRRITFALVFMWVAQTMNFYGLSFFSVRLRGNPYIIAFIGGLMGIPAGIVKFCLYHWFDRRRPLMAIFMLGFVTCAGGVVVHELFHEHILHVVFATAGIGFSSAGMMMLYTITPELYPTQYRTFATGFFAGAARVGAILSMFVERLDETIWSGLPMLIFCIAFIVCFVMIAILPPDSASEGKALPDNDFEANEPLPVVPSYDHDTVFGSKISCTLDLSMI